VLCFQRYKKICWTQKPLFDKNVEPNSLFLQRCPKLGKPSPEDVINHRFYVINKIKSRSWKSSENYNVVKKIIKKIYEIMNEISKENLGLSIDTEEKLFLNGKDPFDEENWMAGSELISGLEEDTKGYTYKVKDYLIPYKYLLIRAGAREPDSEPISKTIIHDQKEVIINSLINL
jgi:hypothetical protein